MEEAEERESRSDPRYQRFWELIDKLKADWDKISPKEREESS
jgi:hypothetical protein